MDFNERETIGGDSRADLVAADDGCHGETGASVARNCRIGPVLNRSAWGATPPGSSVGEACLIHNNRTVGWDVGDGSQAFGHPRRDGP
jgi:hypothetical protein